ncbi:MAG: nucleotidyltransferase family protein [Flavobacteriales bacterium]|nr:nucleotidyltransferase family protein [Flavobacteriales bacterium]
MSKTAVLILAAGASKRIGKPKQLLPYKESNLLLEKIKQFQSVEKVQVFVVLGAYFKEIIPMLRELPVKVVMNENWKEGMGSSLSKGIELIKKKELFDRVLITLSDLPLMESSHYEDMIELSKNTGKRIIQTTYEHGAAGVPAIFDKSLFRRLSQLTDENGAKSLIKTYKKEVLELRSKTPFFDVDTLEAYQQLLKLS